MIPARDIQQLARAALRPIERASVTPDFRAYLAEAKKDPAFVALCDRVRDRLKT